MTNPVNYNDILSIYSAYPAPIRPFLLYADTHGEIRSKLTKTIRLAFIDLVARANIADASQPILVRVDHTAEKLGISEKSVSRTIRMMRKNGWIEPSNTHDGRNNNGEFAWKEYTFTPGFRALLRMPASQAPADHGSDGTPEGGSASDDSASTEASANADARTTASPSPAPYSKDKQPSEAQGFCAVRKALDTVQRMAQRHTTGAAAGAADPSKTIDAEAAIPRDISDADSEKADVEPKMSSGLIYAVNKVFLKKEASLQKEPEKKEASFEKAPTPEGQKTRKQVRVPAGLKELCDLLEILPEGVCALMALAKAKGHWLQDVWTAKRETLLNAGVKAGRAVRYIEFLLNCGEDFAYVARTKISVPKTAPLAQPQAQAPAAGAAKSAAPANVQQSAPAPLSDQGKAQDADEALKAIAKAARYKRFRHISKSIQVRIYEGSAEVTDGVKNAILGGWTQMVQIYRDIASGQLVEVPQ